MDIFVTRQGSIVGFSGGRVVVTEPSGQKHDAPVELVRSVTLLGGIEITHGALAALAERGTPVHWATLGGKPVGSFFGHAAHGAYHRIAQVRALDDEPFRLSAARRIVSQKLLAQRACLAERQWRNPSEAVERTMAALDRVRIHAESAPTIQRLLILEARAAKLAFQAMNCSLPQEFRFERRSRRPPEDPFNALISLGYTLLLNEMLALIVAKGLDPYIGALHAAIRNQPALALDLMEPFRSIVAERWAMRVVALKIVQAKHFEAASGGGVHIADHRVRLKALDHFRRQLEGKPPQGFGREFGSTRSAMAAAVDEFAGQLDGCSSTSH